MAEVDLHLHTTYSDGRLTPTQLVDLVAERGLRVVAVTDHDSTEGLAEAFEAAEKHPQLTIIPGIELSTDIPGNEIHVLGYFIDYFNPGFQQTLAEFREGRLDRGRRMVDNLEKLGLSIDWERVLELSDGGAVGRPHIAQAMVEKGYITYPQEAFDKYIGRNGPAYAERPKLAPDDAVRMILEVGGLPVLAHPARYVQNPEGQLPVLKGAGLVGMEVYYKDYTPGEIEDLLGLCRKYDLIPTGGSDYHALGTSDEVVPGSVGPPVETAKRLFSLAGLEAGISL